MWICVNFPDAEKRLAERLAETAPAPVERTVDAPIVETREAYDFTAPRAPGEPAPRKRKAKG